MRFSAARRRFFSQTQQVFRLLAQGQARFVVRAVETRLRSEVASFGLRRDLMVPHQAPAAKIPLIVRALERGDDLSMLDLERGEPSTAYGRQAQRLLVAANIPTCWVAIAPAGKVCYMQWLIAPRDNDRVQARWGDLFPRLGPEEALLEGAYTDDAYRGQGIMAHAMSLIADQAREFGGRWVVTFVAKSNIASLKGCKKAGFAPYVERTESWRLLRRRVRFAPLPEGTGYSFD